IVVGADAELGAEDPPQVAAADAKARRQLFQGEVLQKALVHQLPGGVGQVAAAVQGGVARGDLRAAAQAGTVAGLFRRGGAGEKQGVRGLGGAHPADGPAVDTGTGDSHEKPAIEAGIAAQQGGVAALVGVCRGPTIAPGEWDGCPFSELMFCRPGPVAAVPGVIPRVPVPAYHGRGFRGVIMIRLLLALVVLALTAYMVVARQPEK